MYNTKSLVFSAEFFACTAPYIINLSVSGKLNATLYDFVTTNYYFNFYGSYLLLGTQQIKECDRKGL